jgi:microcompartment protein CcmL/EutN
VTDEIQTPCPTCRAEVIHLHVITRVHDHLAAALPARPRLRRELDKYKDARRKALRRFAAHLLEHANTQKPEAVA